FRHAGVARVVHSFPPRRSSDLASAVLEHTRSVVYLDDGDIAVLTPAGYAVLDRESHVQLRAVDDVAWDVAQLELGGHAHFMLKEDRKSTRLNSSHGSISYAVFC